MAANGTNTAKVLVSPRYLLPLATALLIGVCVLLYYLTYVQQHREYLLNRNYRVLATLGEQMTETLANQVAILSSYVNAFEDGEFDATNYRVLTYERKRGESDVLFEPKNQLVALGDSLPTTMGSVVLHSIAPRLHYVQIREFNPKGKVPTAPDLVRRDGEWSFQLAALDNDGDHEASAIISLQDLAQSFSPSITDTFDDVLIAQENGGIIYQRQRIGPHFSDIADLVKNAAKTAGKGGGSTQLIEASLAGVPYLIFLEPVTIDLNPGSKTGKPITQRFTLVGLVPSRHFRWESLAISYRAIIFSSSIFLLLCLATPIIKVLFLNERGRLRLREIVLLPLLFAMIAGALTSIFLQTIYFDLRHDDTDTQLQNISAQMQKNVREELSAMRRQLIAACRPAPGAPDDLNDDLGFPHLVIRNRVLESEPVFGKNAPYPFFANLFWTDAQGRQTIKWSPTTSATPLIDVSGLEFFRSLATDNRYFFLDAKYPFRFDSLLPPNQDSYVGVLGMRMADCRGADSKESGFAFLSARPLSLIDPILPLGVGFALVDDTGRVLFHSDKFRNNRENVLVETSNDRELAASLYGHSNEENFSLDYRGNEVRARVVPIAGVVQSPWSLIIYKDARYLQTYDLEVLTMAGALLIGYLGIPALIACFFFFMARPTYVPGWLWPSPSWRRIYRFQIEASAVMMVMSAALIFLRPIEESLYAAAAAGYVTLIIVFWSALSDKPASVGRSFFDGICGMGAILLVAFPLWERWWWSVPIGLVLFPFAWALRRRKNDPGARQRFANLSYRSLYNVRAMTVLAVVGILPPLSFFRNSKLLEDTLHIRAAQLHAAMAWNARERSIESLERDVPLATEGRAMRCDARWDVYLSSYFRTSVSREHLAAEMPSSNHLDARFLRFAHFLHHSFNQIGAEALGVLQNPALPDSSALPEDVYVPKSLANAANASPLTQKPGDLPEWEWVRNDTDPRHPLQQLWVHEGADASNTCATPAKNELDRGPKPDLVVSSELPRGEVSAASNLFTFAGVTAVMGLLFWLVTRRIFLFDLKEPTAQPAEELEAALRGRDNLLILTTSGQAAGPDTGAAGDAVRIDVRKLSARPDWGEKFDPESVPAGSAVIVENFDWELAAPEMNQQRLAFAESLTAEARRVILVSAVDPAPFLIEDRGLQPTGAVGRWAAVLGKFKRINAGGAYSWKAGDTIERALPALWRECVAHPGLHPIANDLWHERKHQTLEEEQIIAEVGERAQYLYYLEWRSCTPEECFVLTVLASDGTVNPRNTASLRQLLRRCLIVRDPQFRIMNESFRRFVLVQSSAMQEEWDAQAAASGWGRVRGPFATTLVLVGIFLLSTQQQFLQTSSGLLTAAGGCVAALLKLVGMAQGRSSDA
jgi:hypothetical protein